MLTFEPLAKGRLFCIVPEGHPLARGSRISAADIVAPSADRHRSQRSLRPHHGRHLRAPRPLLRRHDQGALRLDGVRPGRAAGSASPSSTSSPWPAATGRASRPCRSSSRRSSRPTSPFAGCDRCRATASTSSRCCAPRWKTRCDAGTERPAPAKSNIRFARIVSLDTLTLLFALPASMRRGSRDANRRIEEEIMLRKTSGIGGSRRSAGCGRLRASPRTSIIPEHHRAVRRRRHRRRHLEERLEHGRRGDQRLGRHPRQEDQARVRRHRERSRQGPRRHAARARRQADRDLRADLFRLRQRHAEDDRRRRGAAGDRRRGRPR